MLPSLQDVSGCFSHHPPLALLSMLLSTQETVRFDWSYHLTILSRELITPLIPIIPWHQEQNISHCMRALNHKFPNIEESIKTPVGCGELLALLCICAEQTFTEESAVDKHFGPAFSRAIVAYIGSPTEAKMIKEIREIVDLPEIGIQQTLERIDDQAEMLTKIIMKHPLRIRGTKKGLIRRPW
ncbi:hypothetical protein MVEN_00177700 [Mycena venus]|uniref:Uncharacterized protein n=1 Tax=Mycena venus TaxID=2733690 RepID=A0A8H7DAP9_9AGAR|nr:hypothetical protein MVEN_00177700 [Mycena venus]